MVYPFFSFGGLFCLFTDVINVDRNRIDQMMVCSSSHFQQCIIYPKLYQISTMSNYIASVLIQIKSSKTNLFFLFFMTVTNMSHVFPINRELLQTLVEQGLASYHSLSPLCEFRLPQVAMLRTCPNMTMAVDIKIQTLTFD